MTPLLAAASTALLHNALLVGAILFALGLVGILTRRNLIVMFLCAELMLQGISVSLVAWNAILYVRVRQRLGIRPTAI